MKNDRMILSRHTETLFPRLRIQNAAQNTSNHPPHRQRAHRKDCTTANRSSSPIETLPSEETPAKGTWPAVANLSARAEMPDQISGLQNYFVTQPRTTCFAAKYPKVRCSSCAIDSCNAVFASCELLRRPFCTFRPDGARSSLLDNSTNSNVLDKLERNIIAPLAQNLRQMHELNSSNFGTRRHYCTINLIPPPPRPL